jgi:cbb3-type cytochrome oxidase subunit 3
VEQLWGLVQLIVRLPKLVVIGLQLILCVFYVYPAHDKQQF